MQIPPLFVFPLVYSNKPVTYTTVGPIMQMPQIAGMLMETSQLDNWNLNFQRFDALSAVLNGKKMHIAQAGTEMIPGQPNMTMDDGQQHGLWWEAPYVSLHIQAFANLTNHIQASGLWAQVHGTRVAEIGRENKYDAEWSPYVISQVTQGLRLDNVWVNAGYTPTLGMAASQAAVTGICGLMPAGSFLSVGVANATQSVIMMPNAQGVYPTNSTDNGAEASLYMNAKRAGVINGCRPCTLETSMFPALSSITWKMADASITGNFCCQLDVGPTWSDQDVANMIYNCAAAPVPPKWIEVHEKQCTANMFVLLEAIVANPPAPGVLLPVAGTVPQY